MPIPIDLAMPADGMPVNLEAAHRIAKEESSKLVLNKGRFARELARTK